MEDKYGLYRQTTKLRNGDFEEEDIWSVLKGKTVTSHHFSSSETSSSSSLRVSTSKVQAVPRAGHEALKTPCQSVPVSIANKASGNSATWYGHGHDGEDEDDDDDDDDGDYDQKLPPHEFIARRLAKNQISSCSVFEGLGRTLKGRDLSKVRNAVLSKTGFLESL